MRYEISGWQLTMLLVSINLSIMVSYAPTVSSVLPPVRAAWMADIIAGAAGLALTFVAYALCRRLQGQTLFEMTRAVWGRFLGAIITMAIVVYFLFWATATTRQFAVLMDSVVFLRTPEVVFVTAFLVLGFIGAGLGMEFMGRAAEISGILIMIGTAVIIAGVYPALDLGMLRPLLDGGAEPILRQALTTLGMFGTSVWVVLLALPHLNKMRDGVNAIFLGTGLNVFFAALGSAVLIAIFGPELLSVVAFAPLSAARIVQFGSELERIEWLLLVLWLAAMGLQISLLTYGAGQGLLSLFPRAHAGWVMFVVVSAIFVWSLFLHSTLTDVLTFFEPRRYLVAALPLQVAPVLYLIVAFARGVNTRTP